MLHEGINSTATAAAENGLEALVTSVERSQGARAAKAVHNLATRGLMVASVSGFVKGAKGLRVKPGTTKAPAATATARPQAVRPQPAGHLDAAGDRVNQAAREATFGGAVYEPQQSTKQFVSREARWRRLAQAEHSRLPKEVVAHIDRHQGKKVSQVFGLELAHLPKKPTCRGHDYSEALPKTTADHRGLEHRFLKERTTGTVISKPKASRENNSLSHPKAGVLPQ